MPGALFFLAAVALLGHMALAVGFWNRTHSTGWPRPLIKFLTLCALVWTIIFPPLAVLKLADPVVKSAGNDLSVMLRGLLSCYVMLCWFVAVIVVAAWVWRRGRWVKTPLLADHARLLKIGDQKTDGYGGVAAATNSALAGKRAIGRVYARIPFNQSWSMCVNEKTLAIPRLPESLDGLSILHLSDFHFTGYIDKPYFVEVCRLAQETRPDLIALTGDFVDNPRCIEWIPDTLGQLSAPLGAYFVFGNHDPRSGALPQLRDAMLAAQFVDLNGKWRTVSAGGGEITLCGTAMPWVGPAPSAADRQDTHANDTAEPLRLLLSHCPDQIGWARQNDFDLMLAGHTHGGQVCLPLVGPVLSPSRYGVYYVAGVFYEPPTVMHVSRGVSGESPIRWNCSPEATKLVLRRTA